MRKRLFCAGLIVLVGTYVDVGKARDGRWTVEDQQIAEALRQAEVDPLQEVIVKLKHAIKIKDFSTLREYAPTSQRISWGSCNSDIGGPMTVQKAIEILGREARKGTAIGVFEISDAGMIETFGWSEPDSYIYFVFTKATGSWKLSSICESPRRSIDFRPTLEK